MDFNKRELELIFNSLKYLQADIRNTLPWRTSDIDDDDYVKEIQQIVDKVYTLMASTP